MRKKLVKISMACLLLLLISCKDTHEKAQDFVDDYNAAAPGLKSQSLQSTIAELKPDNTIHIIMVSNMEQSEENKGAMSQVLPGIMNEVLKKVPYSKELADEGVKFKIDYRASDNTPLVATIIDKASLKMSADKDSTAEHVKFSTSNTKAIEMLEVLNKTLPIVDKKAGTKITKIDVINEELVYFIEVDEELKGLLKGADFVTIMKGELKKSPQIKGLMISGNSYGIKKVRCKYIDADKKPVVDIVINEKEMQ
jgi:hypothetical protein